jgi:hypothetical protein
MSPDLSTARPLSTRPVRPSPILCTRSPTPVTILVATRHAAPTTYTPRDKQTRFFERNKGKRKTKQNYPRFEFKPRQVNDSSQSNQITDHLVSHRVFHASCTYECPPVFLTMWLEFADFLFSDEIFGIFNHSSNIRV